jgi:hypothetical protein
MKNNPLLTLAVVALAVVGALFSGWCLAHAIVHPADLTPLTASR